VIYKIMRIMEMKIHLVFSLSKRKRLWLLFGFLHTKVLHRILINKMKNIHFLSLILGTLFTFSCMTERQECETGTDWKDKHVNDCWYLLEKYGNKDFNEANCLYGYIEEQKCRMKKGRTWPL